jgi:SpoVK/Ycf46/Vps4 family AAA+-type ATPase
MIKRYEEELTRYLGEANRAYDAGQGQRAEEFLLLGADRLEALLREGPEDFASARAVQLGEVLDFIEHLRTQRKAEPRLGAAAGAAAQLFLVEDKPAITLDDVAGLTELKALIQLRLVEPLRAPEITRKHGIRAGGGVLLYGPPGTGKTLIARALAGTIQAAFIAVKSSDLLDSLYGSTEKRIAALFRQARQYPLAIVFLDELDAIGGNRDQADPHQRRFLNQLLTELDGFAGKAEHVLVLGATNRPWLLDPALLRPGRMDECLYVPLPDEESRQELWRLGLRGRVVDGPIDALLLSQESAGLSGAEIRRICERASEQACRTELRTGQETGVTQAGLLALIPAGAARLHQSEIVELERFAQRVA